jgi:glucose-6-phosphate isomerase
MRNIMNYNSLTDLNVWQDLKRCASEIGSDEYHLKNLIKKKDRLNKYCRIGAGIFYDFSRQRLTDDVLNLLIQLSKERNLKTKFQQMTEGVHLNTTENRAALHTAPRSFSTVPVIESGKDIVPENIRVRKQINEFTIDVHSGKILGSTGLPFKDVVVIGIGGSYLGTEFVATALQGLADKGIFLHFLSNVDIDNFGNIINRIKPESTLWIVISKSYTTPETAANEHQAREFMKQKGLDPAQHLITVTSKGSPGDDPSNPVLNVFHMFDYIGGRFSVTSAVGGVPLSLYIGYERFERFLKGAEEMDIHAKYVSEHENLPLIAALISVWNNNFLGYPACGIIPYSCALSKLAPHIQQLSMESNGKSITQSGQPIGIPCGTIIFGEPGTNAQHSFFQLAHQGRPFPIDFIGIVNPNYAQYPTKSKGVTNHQELWANLIAQPQALAEGKDDTNAAKFFPGNRPSSTILIKDLSPENIGRLLAFYEAKTVFEAFIWDINPFDQFGVELGKGMAADIRKEMAKKNENPGYQFDNRDPIKQFYLETVFKGTFDK